MNTNDTDGPRDEGPFPTGRLPLGAWLRLVDKLISREFAEALEGDDLSRHDWMLLNAIAGTVDAPWVTDRLAAGGARVRRLAERGWITPGDDGWTLTNSGNDALARLTEKVGAVRAKVAGTVSDAEFAQLKTSLEAMARGLGWDESQPLPDRGARGRGFGPKGRKRGDGWGPYGSGHGFGGYGYEFGERRADHGCAHGDVHEHAHGHGHGHANGHGRGHGFDPRAGLGRRHGFDPREGSDPRHGDPEHNHGGRRIERAYERGFAAGFDAAARQGGQGGRGEASTPAA